MKNFKKFTAAIAATLMAATMVAPMALNAFADNDDGGDPSTPSASTTVSEFTFTVDTNLAIKDSKVYATKIFDLEFNADGTVKSVAWATENATLKAEIAKAAGVEGETDAAKIAIAITNENAVAVAKAAAKEVGVAGTAGTYANGKVTFTEGLANGYYLFTCEAKDATSESTTWTSVSLGMLTVVNGSATGATIGTGEAKVGLPKVEKKVLEDDNEADEAATYEEDLEWNDVADLDIGQEATFGLYGTLPDNYDDYDSYYYEFVDELDGVFEKPEVSDFTVTANGATLSAADYEIKVEGSATEGWSISVKFANLKTNKTVTKDTVIIVKYKTALTDAAAVGEANMNEVKLKYSNNPNNAGAGETGTTPEDKVGVYTYDFQFEKKFWNAGSDLTPEEILEGDYEDLKFQIKGKQLEKTTSKKTGSDDVETDDSLYEDYDYVVTGDTEGGGKDTDLTLTIIDKATGKRVSEEEIASAKEDYNSGDAAKKKAAIEKAKGWKLVVRIKGLDSDEYEITEDNTDWSEYNKLQGEEGKFELESNLTYTQDETTFGDATYSYDTNDDGYMQIDNKKGTSLPSTGGIGTTLFYLGGGAMVAVAGVFLITKKRMGKDEA